MYKHDPLCAKNKSDLYQCCCHEVSRARAQEQDKYEPILERLNLWISDLVIEGGIDEA